MSSQEIVDVSHGAVALEVRGPAAWVTIARPEARNAINGAVAAGLEAALDFVESSDELWVGVLTGTGPAFSAGADLKEVAAGRGQSLTRPRGGFGGFVAYPRTRPWIAAVNGLALGGGLELALACDLVVAVTNAEFGLPEVARGLIAGAGGIFRLPRVVPRNIALELIATGSRLSATRAESLGLVNRIAPAGELETTTQELVDAICANAPLSVRESLAVARDAYRLSDSEGFERTAAASRIVTQTEDFVEGPRAFIEKRPPKWKGR